ncbi:MAG: rhodanese-like domain-containing protein [Spirochaetes bacterium]|nr:rhodanese-like domain-containing protein [Spirochaetota bacterium]
MIITSFSTILFCSEKNSVSIDAEKSKKMIDENKNNKDFIIIDVRTPQEYSQGHIENSINIDFYAPDFQEKISALDRNKTYLVYCRSGNRSAQSIPVFQKAGIKNFFNMTGGFSDWVSRNFPFTVK